MEGPLRSYLTTYEQSQFVHKSVHIVIQFQQLAPQASSTLSEEVRVVTAVEMPVEQRLVGPVATAVTEMPVQQVWSISHEYSR